MFNRRKPVYANVTYIFDALNESNLANSTSVVTTIKKGKKKGTWIVVSVNNGDIFECPEDLLTEFIEYDKVNDIIRCQYGATDINASDVAYADLIVSLLEFLKNDKDTNPMLQDMIKDMDPYAKQLRDKLTKYAAMSNYTKTLSVISTINKVKKRGQEIDFSEKLQPKESLEERERKRVEHFITNSEFYHLYDDTVREYMEGEISFDYFLDRSLELMETEFPKDILKPLPECRIVDKEDVKNLIRMCKKIITTGNIVFLIGRTSKEEQIALAVYSKEDLKEIGKFVNTCYDLWEDHDKPYEAKYKICVLSAPRRMED